MAKIPQRPLIISRPAFAMTETLIVLLLLTGLALGFGLLVSGVDQEDRRLAAEHNLQRLQAEIHRFRRDHGGMPPLHLEDLLRQTNRAGRIVQGVSATGGGFGPYLRALPHRPSCDCPQGEPAQVRLIYHDPAVARDATGAGDWLYNPVTGRVWLDDPTWWKG